MTVQTYELSHLQALEAESMHIFREVAAVICGEVDAYVHGGGFYEWDTAAPVAVARAAGLHASRIDGSALAYNQADLLMPDILVCRPALAGTLLRAIREVTHAP